MQPMYDLTTRDIQYLQGVGPQRAALLAKELGIGSMHDLLYNFPYKYVDRSRLYYIHEIDGNMPYIQLKGKILRYETVGTGRKMRLVAHFTDGTGVIDLVWFNGAKFIPKSYPVGVEYIVFGKPTMFGDRINVAHPDIDKASELSLSSMGLQPYYNTTERMKRSGLNSNAMQKIVGNLFALLDRMPIAETLPAPFVQEHHLMPLPEALHAIHFPKEPEQLRRAQYRLKFEELFYVQLSILRYCKDRRRKYRGLCFTKVGELFNEFYAKKLPFELTGAQNLTQTTNDTHHVGGSNDHVELEPVLLGDLLNQVHAADIVSACSLGILTLGILGEDQNAAGLAGAVGQNDSATNLLVGVTGVNAQLDVDFDGLVELSGSTLQNQIQGFVGIILNSAVNQLCAFLILFASKHL